MNRNARVSISSCYSNIQRVCTSHEPTELDKGLCMIGIEGKLKGVEYEEGSGVEETDSNKAEY